VIIMAISLNFKDSGIPYLEKLQFGHESDFTHQLYSSLGPVIIGTQTVSLVKPFLYMAKDWSLTKLRQLWNRKLTSDLLITRSKTIGGYIRSN